MLQGASSEKTYPTPRIVWISFVGDGVVDLRAEIADVDVDDVAEAVEVLVPDVLGDHGPREHVTLVAHQVLEQGELLGRQADPPPTARHLSGCYVDLEVADPHHGLPESRAAPQEGPDARNELGEAEGLDEVVVRAAR